MTVTTRIKGILTGLLLATSMAAASAASESYVGPFTLSGNTWSNSTNWSPGTAPTSGDTATITDTSTTSGFTLNYDTASNGSLGTLNLTNTGTFTETLDLQKSLQLTTVTSFGGAGSGQINIYVDESANNSNVFFGSTGGVTLNNNSMIELQTGTTTAFNSPRVNGNLTIAGGALNVDESSFGSATATQGQITGNLNMSSGSININTTPTNPGTAYAGNTRFYVMGLLTTNGGAITSGAAGSSLYLAPTSTGGTNTIGAGTTFDTSIQTVFYTSFASNTLNSAATLGALQLRASGTGSPGQTVNFNVGSGSSSTLTVGAIQFNSSQFSAQYENVYFQLNSNITVANNVEQPVFVGGTGVVNTIDPNGHTLDLTHVSTAAGTTGGGDNSGIFSPGTVLPNVNSTGNSTATYTLGSGAGGTIAALGFDLHGGTTGTTVSNVAGTVVLQSTGTIVANNLSNSSTSGATSAGTISSSSTFLYSGAATTTGQATLVSNRQIGGLQVQNGRLTIAQSSLTASGPVAISSGGTLDLNGSGAAAVGSLTLTSGANFTVSTGVLALNLGASLTSATYDQIIGTTGDTFTLTNLSLAITQDTGFSTSNSYQLFSGFDPSTAVSNISTNVSGYNANISTSGMLTFSAVPEPGSWALVLTGVLVLVFFQRRKKTA